MPLLHWYCYSFLKGIFNCFAYFATDFGNGNVMSENSPVAELNKRALVRSMTVMKTFCSQNNLHQDTMIPITVMTSYVSAYTVSVWNNIVPVPVPLVGNSAGILPELAEILVSGTFLAKIWFRFFPISIRRCFPAIFLAL